jgi:hypothetical protein
LKVYSLVVIPVLQRRINSKDLHVIPAKAGIQA